MCFKMRLNANAGAVQYSFILPFEALTLSSPIDGVASISMFHLSYLMKTLDHAL